MPTSINLNNALVGLAIAALVIAAAACRRESGGADDLLTVQQVQQLCVKRDAAQRVRFQGVMTLADAAYGFVIVQENSGGIRVRLAGGLPEELPGQRNSSDRKMTSPFYRSPELSPV